MGAYSKVTYRSTVYIFRDEPRNLQYPSHNVGITIGEYVLKIKTKRKLNRYQLLA